MIVKKTTKKICQAMKVKITDKLGGQTNYKRNYVSMHDIVLPTEEQ